MYVTSKLSCKKLKFLKKLSCNYFLTRVFLICIFIANRRNCWLMVQHSLIEIIDTSRYLFHKIIFEFEFRVVHYFDYIFTSQKSKIYVYFVISQNPALIGKRVKGFFNDN